MLPPIRSDRWFRITDSNNFASVPPPIAYDSVTNQAILGGGTGML